MHAKKLIIYFSVLFIFTWCTLVAAESRLIDIPQGKLLDFYLNSQTDNDDQTDNTEVSTNITNSAEVEIQQTQSNSNDKIHSVSHSAQELEVIQIDNTNEKIATVSLTDPNKENFTPAKIYCRENPRSQECLYSEYLSSCKKDPRTSSCRHELEQFYSFCMSFPRDHKCKNAQLFAPCKREPNSIECKKQKERWCQKSPDAIFCG